MPAWQFVPSATLNISQKLSHEAESIIMGDSLNQGTTISCANNYRWKWASGSSLSSGKLCPSIAVNKCLSKLLLNSNNQGNSIGIRGWACSCCAHCSGCGALHRCSLEDRALLLALCWMLAHSSLSCVDATWRVACFNLCIKDLHQALRNEA